jgi:glucose/arabinose dehydrogenase
MSEASGRSPGQDGLMGMVFDPDFNNTHYIYAAYIYDAASDEELDRKTKITRFTYDAANNSIGNPISPEHGDNSDDEINSLQAGGNYGWPYVSGYNDDKAYQYVN